MTQDRMIWLDGLRLFAGLSMVGLHCTADPNGLPWVAYSMQERVAPLLMRAVFYTARTELFLMISVFLLLLSLDRRPRSYGDTLREQAKRLLIPFCFWTVFYAGFNVIKASHFGYAEPYLEGLTKPSEWLGFLLLGDVKYHMHFLPTLFALLLFYPIFAVAKRNPWLGVLVFACLMLRHELDAYLYRNFWGDEILPYLLRAVKVATYIGYGISAAAFLGIWQRRNAVQWSSLRMPMIVVGALLFLFKLQATRKTIIEGEWQYSDLLGYWADFLMPVLLFAIVMAVGNKPWSAWVSDAARFSFGIYLCHPIFLDFSEIALSFSNLSPFSQVLLKISIAVSCTGLFVVVMSRFQAVSWTIGLGRFPAVISLNQWQREAR